MTDLLCGHRVLIGTGDEVDLANAGMRLVEISK